MAKTKPIDPEEEITKKVELENQIKQLKSRLREAEANILNSNKMLEFVHGTKQTTFNTKPTWLTIRRKRRNLTGIPVLFLSDLHFDEIVNPKQVESLNKFNREIAVERLLHTFATTVKFCTGYMKDPKYDGIVCALGGDMLSGNIHEELAESNEAPILESAMYLTEVLIQGLSLLADKFDRVFVPCVVGNHGRLHRKPRAKNRVKDNYEWLIYHNIARHFKDDKRFTFQIPESADAQFQIYNKSFLLTHGDQFRGGNGIAGIFSPLMLGAARKQRRTQFDIMMIGHFHQYIHTNNLIVNGTLKGYDEYAYISNFGFEEPQQALFIVHPTYGVTFRMPIVCNSYEAEDETESSNRESIKIWASK